MRAGVWLKGDLEARLEPAFQGTGSWQGTRGREGRRGFARGEEKRGTLCRPGGGAPASQWQLLLPPLGPRGTEDPKLGREVRQPPLGLHHEGFLGLPAPCPESAGSWGRETGGSFGCCPTLTHAFQSHHILF